MMRVGFYFVQYDLFSGRKIKTCQITARRLGLTVSDSLLCCLSLCNGCKNGCRSVCLVELSPLAEILETGVQNLVWELSSATIVY